MSQDQKELINELIPYTDFKKPSKHMLIDLINWANRKSMTTRLEYDQVLFSTPAKAAEGSDMNTLIRFTKVAGYKLTGDEEIQYNRLDIDQLAKLMNFTGSLQLDPNITYKTMLDILPALFEQFPIYLDENDIHADELRIDFRYIDPDHRGEEGYGIPVVLRVKDESIGYYGKLILEIHPKPIRLKTAIQTTAMPGFVYTPTHGLS